MKIIEKYLLGLIFLFFVNSLNAQDTRSLTARYIQEDITIDGFLDDPIWEQADAADDFWQFFPTDSLKARSQTSVKLLYNDKTLFIAVIAEAVSNDYVVSSLRRDFSGTGNDNVAFVFDTFSDGANAFMFGVTPYGVQREVLISDGGSERGFNPSWDMKWKAESKQYEDHYVVEVAIPFTSVKFKEGTSSWRFQTYRWDIQTNEQSAWVRVPQNQLLSSLGFMGELNFEKPLGRSRTPVALIPYVNGLVQKDFIRDESDSRLKVGGDAKVAVGNSMNLDVTINPDFSNVEVDDIFTNLTRFEVLLPEKRQFFIDNSDLFGSYGSIYNDASPFFSRRIGLARDTAGNLIQNDILGGVRLSGKLNQNWRLGLLNIQTAEDIPNEIASNNNMMIALQRKVFSRSSIGAFFINRQTIGDYEFQNSEDEYNRVAGLDYNLASADNTWTGKFYLHKSFQEGDNEGNLSSQATVTYNTRYWNVVADLVYIDQDFRSDLGFIPRKDVVKNGMGVARTFYPKSGFINKHTPRVISLNFWRPSLDYQNTDRLFRYSYTVEFKDQSTFEARYLDQYVYLTADFDPTRTNDGDPLIGQQGYHFNQYNFSYTSNFAKRLTFTTDNTFGEFFNGKSTSISGQLAYRIQPWMNFSVNVRYDQINLPDPHPDGEFWLVTPKAEVTFSKSLFWSTLIQYSNQRDNIGVNSRLQWRYAPLSDLFIVYNDNYFPTGFGPKFRSINLKLTYWFNPS